MLMDDEYNIFVLIEVPVEEPAVQHVRIVHDLLRLRCTATEAEGRVGRMNLPRVHGPLFHVLDVAFNLIVILAIVLGIRTFLVMPFQVEGKSMDSTLADQEYIIINKLAYYLGDPQRGDVVVFHPPNAPGKYYVKRIIGVGGDEITLRGGQVYIKRAGETAEERLEEAYLDVENQGKTFRHATGGDASPARFLVPAEHYFLLGDNRQNSTDSRGFNDGSGQPSPYVEDVAVAGRVWFVALPLSKIHVLEPPQY